MEDTSVPCDELKCVKMLFGEEKGLCHKVAVEQGIRHCQLPLNKYVNMKTRKVLTIDHVFEIVLRVCEGVSWQDTLLKVLPLRKGAHICQSLCDSTSSEDISNQSTNGT